MRCQTFVSRLETVLAGDDHPTLSGELDEHSRVCPTCRSIWRSVGRVPRLLDDAGAAFTPATFTRLRRRLLTTLSSEGCLPVRFGSRSTVLGPVFIGVSARGVCQVAFGCPDDRAFQMRLRGQAPEIVRDDRTVRPVFDALERYLAGEQPVLSVRIDLGGLSPFTRRVLEAARRIGFGQVTAYGELALSIDVPGGARAVGNALGRNPVPIFVPCHRVIRGGGRLGGYTGGPAIKRRLLRLEGHSL